jgi:hypothetical protein
MVRSGLSASALIRAMLLEQKIAERPSAAYLKLYKELYLTCNNINQIARASNTIGVLDAKMANEAMAELTELIRSLKE